MLSDDELTAIAKTYSHQYAAGNALSIPNKIADPPGLYFRIAYLYEQTGDAGFFVSRTDGRIVTLGSGSFVPFIVAGLDLSTKEGRAEALRRANTEEGHTEILKHILLPILARPAPSTDASGIRVQHA